MTSKTIHFLAGLPRTGSTLLGALLSQNPDVTVTATSPTLPLLIGLSNNIHVLQSQHTFDSDRVRDEVSDAIVRAMYADVETPIVFDKHRGWPENVQAIKRTINPDPRIIATVRPVAEIVASYITLCDMTPVNFIDEHIRHDGHPVTNENRASLIWEKYLYPTWGLLTEALQAYPEQIMLVQYDDLVFDPHPTLARIYDFCHMTPFRHQLHGIESKWKEEKDEEWGAKGLHDIRPSLSKQSIRPEHYLSADGIEFLSQFDIKEAPCHASL